MRHMLKPVFPLILLCILFFFCFLSGCSGGVDEGERIVSCGEIFDFLKNFDNPRYVKEITYSLNGQSSGGIRSFSEIRKTFMDIQGRVKMGFAMESPSSLAFTSLPVRRNATLCFSLAVRTQQENSPQKGEGIFDFYLKGEKGFQRRIFHRALPLEKGRTFGGWSDHRVPVEGIEKEEVTFLFSFKAEEGGRPVQHLEGFLAFPRLLFEQEEKRVREVPIVLETVKRDLIQECKGAPHGDQDWTGAEKRVLENFPPLEGREVIQVEERSRFSLPVEVPPQGFLEVEMGIYWLNGQEGEEGLTFRIEVDRKEIFSRSAGPSSYLRLARDWIDLSPWGKKKITLSFITGPVREPLHSKPVLGWTRISVSGKRFIQRELPGKEKPNLIVLLIDTLRTDHLGCYGYERETTPNMDRFAQKGVLFQDCIAQSSWTLPSTASLFTGLYPGSHGVLDNERGNLHPSLEILPEQLLLRGITTAGFSANFLIGKEFQFDRGFETFEENFGMRAEEVNQFFLEWLDRVQDFRFFAYLHYLDPHSTYSAPDPFYNFFDRTISRKDNEETVKKIRNWERDFKEGRKPEIAPEELERIRALYDGEILYWDFCFGKLMKVLDERGLLENTIVVITADHGEEFLDHSYIGHGTNLYDELLRVPLIFRYPPLLPGGKAVRGQVELIDIPPTLYFLMNVPQPEGMQGMGLFPLESFQEKGRSFASTFHGLEFQEGKKIDFFEKTCVRTDGLKVVHFPRQRRWRLFKREKDGEWRSVDPRAEKEKFTEMKQFFGQRAKGAEENFLIEGNWKLVHESREEEWKFLSCEAGRKESPVDPAKYGSRGEELQGVLKKWEEETRRSIDNYSEVDARKRSLLKQLGYIQK